VALIRGAEHRRRIAEVARLFSSVSDQLVFCGSCVLALYSRPVAPSRIRPTKDVDCICTLTPYIKLSSMLADMCNAGILVPDPELLCRYVVRESGTVIDIIDVEGRSIGADDPWIRRAADHAARYAIEGDLHVSAVAPPYFLAMKLAALLDRGPDEMSTDAEDIVTLSVEVEDLVPGVRDAGLEEEVGELMTRVLTRLDLTSWRDLVDYHIDPQEAEHAGRVGAALSTLSRAPAPPPAGRGDG
jgi:hypothetical protein